MTAINIIRKRDRIAVLTDTAMYDRDGVVRAFNPKSVTIPHLNAVLASRGSGFATAIFATALGMRFQSFDALIAEGGGVAEECYTAFFPLLTASGETEVELHIAGWSEARRRPEIYDLYSDYAPGGEDCEPWVFHGYDDDAYLMAPDIEFDELRRHGFPTTKSPQDLDPMTDGLAIMEAQRHFRGATLSGSDDDSHHLVGGSVILTEIRQDGITQRVIRRWNDRANERIVPEPVNAVAPMSRAERRRYEREQRKVRA